MQLKQFLKQRKISQQKLANKLGIQQQVVSRWCCGNCLPRVDEVIRLKKILNLTSDEVLALFEGGVA